jgi:hypothetical protein
LNVLAEVLEKSKALTWDGTSTGGTILFYGFPYIAKVICVLLCAASPAFAGERADKLNSSTIGLLVADAQWLPEAAEIASALQHHDGMRVLPMVGQGTVQTIFDLIHLQGVDAAILPLDTLTYAKSQGLMQGLDGKISYVARLQPLRWVLLAQRDLGQISDLNTKRIATGPTGSAGFVAGELLFNAQNIEFSRLPVSGAAAIEALEGGQADAALVNVEEASTLRIDTAKYHVLPLVLPQVLAATYVPAILTAEQLPQILSANQSIETVATPLAIMVFNWGKGSGEFESLLKFSTGLFTDDTGLTLETNLAAEIPGWARHDSATAALKKLSLKNQTVQKGDAP